MYNLSVYVICVYVRHVFVCNVCDVSCPCLSYSPGGAIGQERTGIPDTAESVRLIGMQLLQGECDTTAHVSEFLKLLSHDD